MLLVKIKVLNFIRNSLSLASLLNWSVVEIEIFSGGGRARHLMNQQKILPLHQNCDVIYYLGYAR